MPNPSSVSARSYASKPRSVQVLFATAGVMRHYALHSAPLTRAEFRPGQRVAGNKQSLVVERVTESDGLFTYHAGERALTESELDDAQPISRADERLKSARIDTPDRFEFRLDALRRRAAAMRSPAWGLAERAHRSHSASAARRRHRRARDVRRARCSRTKSVSARPSKPA